MSGSRTARQAALLDAFWSALRDNPSADPPAGLDAGLAATVAELERELRPPEPTTAFLTRLRRELLATSAPAVAPNGGVATAIPTGHRTPHAGPTEPVPASPFAARQRRYRSREWLRLVAPIVAFALVGGLLVAVFRDDRRDASTDQQPGATSAAAAGSPDARAPGQTPFDPSGELVVPWDPAGGEHYKLHIVPADGSEPRRLTPEDSEIAGAETGPAWSPDGQRLVFVGYVKDGVDLFVINADGSGLRNLTNQPAHYIQPSWSPDGSRIAFVNSTNDYASIAVINADGSGMRELTRSEGVYDSAPTWSPDGTQIAFLRHEFVPAGEPGSLPTPADGSMGSIAIEGETRSTLYVITADGTSQWSLATVATATAPEWSPDGGRIALTSGWPDEQALVIDEHTLEVRTLVRDGLRSSLPRWSPDGTKISVVVTDPGGSETSIVVMNADGSGARRITELHGWHDWSPDGRSLVVLQARYTTGGEPTGRANLYVIIIDGGEPRLLLDDAAIGVTPAWRPGAAPPTATSPTDRTSTADAGAPITLAAALQAALARQFGGFQFVHTDQPPLISQEDALQAIDDFGIPWALGGEWEGKPVTIGARYGLATIVDGSTWPLPDGTQLQDLEQRPMWIVDYGNVQGVIPSIAPGTTPPPPANHAVYGVDAETRVVWYLASYRDESAPPPAAPSMTTGPSSDTDLSPSYRLRIEEQAREWALRAAMTDEQFEVLDVRLVTLRDKFIEDANRGGGSGYSRDGEDEPYWRVEYLGAAIPFPGSCGRGPNARCTETTHTITWFRASDGQHDTVMLFDPATAARPAEIAAPLPIVDTELGYDPHQPLFPDAEVVHVVAIHDGRRWVQGSEETQGPITIETWLNRVTGDTLIRETRANGDLESLTLRQGTTLVRYLAESYDGSTDDPRYTFVEFDAPRLDDPILRVTTPHLDWYRDVLSRGHAYVGGVGEVDGRAALLVQVAAGTDAAHVAWLDAETLLPLSVELPNQLRADQGRVFETIRYTTVETMSRAGIPEWIFAPAFPADEITPRHELTRIRTRDEAASFDGYPLWSLGASFESRDLVRIRQHAETGEGSTQDDITTFTYASGTDQDDWVIVECQGRLPQWQQDQGMTTRREQGEEIQIDGEPAWVFAPSYADIAWVEIERDSIVIVVRAPDRETAIAAAEALTWANRR
jgi:TolB protein